MSEFESSRIFKANVNTAEDSVPCEKNALMEANLTTMAICFPFIESRIWEKEWRIAKGNIYEISKTTASH